jgi:ATP-binding cassette subfamily C (CFTR/MRP) protein 1
MSISSRKISSSGEVINLIQINAQSFIDLANYFNIIWSAPFQLVMIFGLLYAKLGYSALSGFVVLCLVVPLNTFLTKQLSKKELQKLKHKDTRIKTINEVLSGMKVGLN